jgi:TolB protein
MSSLSSRQGPMPFVLAACFALVVLFSAQTLRAGETVLIDIYGPGQSKLHVALARPLAANGNATTVVATEVNATDTVVHVTTPAANVPAPAVPPEAGTLQKLIADNLAYLPFISLVPGAEILGGDSPGGYSSPHVDFRRFQLSGVDMLLTTGWPQPASEGGYTVEIRAYEIFSGRLILGKAYHDVTAEQLSDVADKFCGALMEELTGRGDFFRSTLAFVKRKKKGDDKHIWTMHPMGRRLTQMTSLKGMSMSPVWSNDGRYILFTHLGSRYHSLGVWDRTTDEVNTVKYPGNTIIGPAFTPDNKVAVSLASGGSPDIYLLNHNFRKEKILVQNWAIDVSPSFDRQGRNMAFVSTRLGNPHIFLKDLETGVERRVTYQGNYNTDPSISPDGELVVFSRLTRAGHRIFVHDLVTGKERQISFGPGNDEQPAFAPDGYFVAFSSNRSGKYRLYLTTRHGDSPRMMDTGGGEAFFPTWGLVPGDK